MSLVLLDSKENKYKPSIKGTVIVSEFLSKFPEFQQNQKDYNLSFSDKFPSKSKAQSYLFGFEVPTLEKLLKFGVKKKNLFSDFKYK